MKIRSVFFLASFLSINLFSQQTWQWGYGAGGAGNDLGYSISTDPYGNSYVTGRFNSTGTFTAQSLTSYGGPDIFITKYSPGGVCLWARHAGSTDISDIYGDAGTGIDIDSLGNCYVTGNFLGGAVFGMDTIGSTSFTGRNIFLAKYDANGNEMWARYPANNGSSGNYSHSVSTDAAGNSWITGYLGSGTNNFGSHVLTGPGGYIVKYDSNGNDVFATKLGVNGAIDLYGVTNDNAGNSYATGYLQGQEIIGSQVFNSTASRDAVLIKVDASGNFSWLRQSITASTSSFPAYAQSNSVCCDLQNGIYICGSSDDDIVFGNDTIDISGTPPIAQREIFLVKYDTSGNEMWADQSVTHSNGSQFDAFSVTADPNSNIYITGVFSADVTFDIQPMNNNMTGQNTYIAMFEPNAGVCQFTIASTGQNPGAFGYGISTDALGSTYITGDDKAPVVFGSYQTSFVGGEDMFIAKIFGGKQSGVNEATNENHVSLIGIQNAFYLTINEPEIIDQAPHFILYDISGRVVKDVPVNSSQTIIDKSGLAPGIYTWQLQNNQQHFAGEKISTF